MCGVFDSVVNAVGSFISSPVGKVVSAVVTDALAIATGNPFAIIAAVGSTVGAIGAVTGNQTLSTVGGVIGAVGMVGGLANAAGLISAEDIFGTSNVWGGPAGGMFASGGGGGDYGFADTSGPWGGGTPGNPLPTPDTGSVPSIDTEINQWSNYGSSGSSPATDTGVFESVSNAISAPTGTTNVSAAAPPDIAGTQAPTLGTGTATGEASATTSTFGEATPTDATGAGSQTASVGPAPPSNVSGTPYNLETGKSLGTISNPGLIDGGKGANLAGITVDKPDTSMWGKISDWVENHPVPALGALMAGASFLSGATSPLTPAQVAAQEAQAQQNLAAANLANQQTSFLAMQQANMSQPLPVATRTTSNSLLNGTPKLAPVTGRPA